MPISQGLTSDGDAVEIAVNYRGVQEVSISPGDGAFPYSYVAAGSANQDAQVIKNAPGVLKSLMCLNLVGTLEYLKIYDLARQPTAADGPLLRLPVPTNSTNGAGFAFPLPAEGIRFSRGIAFRMCTGIADSDATAVTAGDMVVNAAYQ